MLVLFDNGTPRTLARYLIDNHTVTEARARGWDEFENGEPAPDSSCVAHLIMHSCPFALQQQRYKLVIAA
jgi:hypothetical protein